MKIHTFEVEVGCQGHGDWPGVPNKVKLAGVTLWTSDPGWQETEEDVLSDFAHMLAGVIQRDQER